MPMRDTRYARDAAAVCHALPLLFTTLTPYAATLDLRDTAMLLRCRVRQYDAAMP